jgi:hypothetical protein
MTTVVIFFDRLTHGISREEADPAAFAWMTGVAFIIAVIIVAWRLRYVAEVFENGVEVKAQITGVKINRGGMSLTLQYAYLGQPREVKIDQVITGKTKPLLSQKEVTLVIHQEKIKNILIREAYL